MGKQPFPRIGVCRKPCKKLRNSDYPIAKPVVLGAVIDLGFCLDLLDYQNLTYLKIGYEILKETYDKSGFKMPKNKTPKGEQQPDLLIRELDCAVLETLHKLRKDKGLRPFDSVKGVFWEGASLYPDAGFAKKITYKSVSETQIVLKAILFPVH